MTSLTNIPSQCELMDQWNAYVERRDPAAREFLITHYLPFVRRRARVLHAKFRGYVDFDDMVSCGVIGMMKALDAFDPSRGVTFETFCSHRVRGAILDEVRKMDWIPRQVRKKARDLAEAEERATGHFGYQPNDSELASFLKLPTNELHRLRHQELGPRMLSLDSLVQGSAWDGAHKIELDQLSDKQSSEDELKSLRTDLWQILQQHLTRTERVMINLYYLEGMTMKQVGQAMKISESRVSQIHSALLSRLREELNQRQEPKQSLRMDQHKARKSIAPARLAA